MNNSATSQSFNSKTSRRTYFGILIVLVVIGGLIGGAIYATNSFRTSQAKDEVQSAIKELHLALAQNDYEKIYEEYVADEFRQAENHGEWVQTAPLLLVTGIEGTFQNIKIDGNTAEATYDIPGAVSDLVFRLESRLTKQNDKWLVSGFDYSQGYYEEAGSGVSFVPTKQIEL